jgi:hypothetical protein
MYQFSRSIYRVLAQDIAGEGMDEVAANRARVLSACEAAVERLATDRHYFARPGRTLFRDVRCYFPMSRQLHVHQVVERYMALATEYVDRAAEAGVRLDGEPLSCHATTRRGTACQRVPLPGSQYCPSHKHLEEDFQFAAA